MATLLINARTCRVPDNLPMDAAVPEVVKGASARCLTEIELLKRTIGAQNVLAGTKTLGSTQYVAVIVNNMRMDPKKFSVTRSSVLFLLPPDYPRTPPIGCYLNYRWPSADHHFTLQAHYGAPNISTDGWYWYCLGLGGGFNLQAWQQHWRPGAHPEGGHNLVTLYQMAKHAINTGL